MHRLLGSVYQSLVPAPVRISRRLLRVFRDDLGYFRAVRRKEVLGPDGLPCPYYTYAAIFFLETLDLSGKTVFEYGAGFSTLYWARRAKTVTSVESDREWYDKISSACPSNAKITHVPVSDGERYAEHIVASGEKYDIVVIDGYWRLRCVEPAQAALASDGMVILDNADVQPRTRQRLRSAPLIEVPFSGFGPALARTWTTAFYLTRDCTPPVLAEIPELPGGEAVSHDTMEAEEQGSSAD